MKIRPLRFYLALLALGILVPVLLFAVAMVVRFTGAQREAQERGMRETARALAVAIDRELGQSLRALEVLTHERSLREGDLRAFYDTCQDVLRPQQPWMTINLLAPSGKTLFTTGRPFGSVLPDATDRPYFRAVVDTGKPAASDFLTTRALGLRTVMVAVPVFKEGQLTGVLTAAYDVRHFDQLWSDQRVPQAWVGAVVDSEGIILSRSRGASQYVGTPAHQQFLDTVRSAPEGFFPTVTVDGMEAFTAYARAQVAPWTVAFSAPRSTFSASVNRSLLGVLTVGLVCCLIALGWAAWVGRRITQPLRGLARAATDSTASPEAFAHAGSTGISELEGLRTALTRATSQVAEREGALRAQMDAAQAARADAEAANRAKDQFLAMLGHELRNPLAAITSGIKLIAMVKDEPRRERVRALVERQALLLARLVDDLLDVARVTSGRILLQKHPVDLAESVRRAITALELSGRTHAHQVVAEVEPVWTEGDEGRIDQIITNLVSNALKYTPAGGRVIVTTRASGEQAVLEVSDTGVGLSREALGRVFELFYQVSETLDRAQGGLGIGLTLVKRLAELHGGSILAESAGPSRGSTFTLSLPRLATVELTRPAWAAAALPSRRVLVVEDHSDTREAVRALLEAEGHTVFEAEDGCSGLERARSLRPDAIIMDIGLPGQDGYSVARALRSTEEGRGMLLVAVTGYGQQEDRLHALQAGFDEHLVKPMDIGRLRELLSRRESGVRAA
ncbi:ATP-binding protein [Hyalangium sp.]|uniref:hybrid sensor histidine kinase/response regulator n=1 Tax=Hyalangium sp. TaxID=2028555 RepID=UPI002D371BE4|nr:ATP-binding protein [Hyalangium sp.]HYH96359.1 ATP-binding protein [Hyalangium sp.]